ncbi:MAG: hypothetical protein NVSMB9_17660 [Isosphaeraceae bacterium]
MSVTEAKTTAVPVTETQSVSSASAATGITSAPAAKAAASAVAVPAKQTAVKQSRRGMEQAVDLADDFPAAVLARVMSRRNRRRVVRLARVEVNRRDE